MLMCDYYKTCHAQMLPRGITKSVSYFTPRSSRIPGWDRAVFFGLRGFVGEFLIDVFNKEFFLRNKRTVIDEVELVMDNTMTGNADFIRRVEELHDLGYLPIEIYALPEGSHVPMGVPMFCITNTHPDFAWLPQFLESLISSEMWHGIVCATVADKFRNVVDEWYTKTSDADPRYALSAFDFRGEESYGAAVKTGAAWATRFVPCATVGTAQYLWEYYDAPRSTAIKGSPSTEHAVMCSNFAVDGNEEDLLTRLLTEIYPSGNFSMVLDSYDYWHMVKDVLPKFKEMILSRNGTVLIRGDSGDPVKVVTDTVFALWDIFGGTTNSKGYKVLDSHVKAIYGDGITIFRCKKIYKILEAAGFATDNVSLGVGSYSMQAYSEDEKHYPFTRDTFNIAIKCTYVEVDGKPYEVFKAPKGAEFKKSARGCIRVDEKDGKIVAEDGLHWDEIKEEYLDPDNLFRIVFRDGQFTDDRDKLEYIRMRMDNGQY